MAASSNPNTWMKVHVLEGDGVVPHLFQYLFKMDRALRGRHHALAAVTGEDTSGYAIPIPDTIVFDHNFPQAWFRYRDREIIKRPGKYLDAQHIYKGLCRVEPNSGGICAQFSCSVPDPNDPSATGTRVHYLSPTQLEALLYSRGAMASVVKSGVLQKFIPPRGSCNDMIEVVWSPKLSITRRRVNKHSLSSRSVTMDVKGSTFDGPPHLSLESAANDRVSKELTEMVASVAEHLLRHEHKHVSRIAALFKQDRHCQPWLHFATSIRVEGDHLIGGSIQRLPVNLSPQYLHPSTEVTDEFIDESYKRKVILDFRPQRPNTAGSPASAPRYRFSANALARSPSESRNPRLEQKALLREKFFNESRNKTGFEKEAAANSAAGSQAPEVRLLINFLDDTFYALYAARMTMGAHSKAAVITVPRQVELMLGSQRLDDLLVGIMQLRRDRSAEVVVGTSQPPAPAGQPVQTTPGSSAADVTSLDHSAGDAQTTELPGGAETASSVSSMLSPHPPTKHVRGTPKVYISSTGDGEHLVPLCTVREHCDAFVEEFRSQVG